MLFGGCCTYPEWSGKCMNMLFPIGMFFLKSPQVQIQVGEDSVKTEDVCFF